MFPKVMVEHAVEKVHNIRTVIKGVALVSSICKKYIVSYLMNKPVIYQYCLDVLILLQAVHYTAKQEMGQNAEVVMKTLIVTQTEFVNQFVQYKDQEATG